MSEVLIERAAFLWEMVFSGPRLGEGIAAGHAEQVSADRWMFEVEPDPTGHPAASNPEFRGFAASNFGRQRGDDP